MSRPLAPAAAIPLLHRFLGIGLMLVTGGFIVMRFLGAGPRLDDDRAADALVFALLGVSVLLSAVALLGIRPRVPRRAPGQTIDAYWSTPTIGAMALSVWGLLEGAGLTAALGYFLTGQVVCVVAAGAAIVLFRMSGPDALAG